jgi:hypothetical protein
LRTYHVVYLLGDLGIGKRGEERKSLEEPGRRRQLLSVLKESAKWIRHAEEIQTMC